MLSAWHPGGSAEKRTMFWTIQVPASCNPKFWEVKSQPSNKQRASLEILAWMFRAPTRKSDANLVVQPHVCPKLVRFAGFARVRRVCAVRWVCAVPRVYASSPGLRGSARPEQACRDCVGSWGLSGSTEFVGHARLRRACAVSPGWRAMARFARVRRLHVLAWRALVRRVCRSWARLARWFA